MSATDEPQIESVNDILAYRDKQQVYCIEGKLTKLYPPKTTTNSRGEGQLQNGEFTDATGTVKILFSDGAIQDDKTARGQTVRISSVNGDHGWNGIKFKKDEKWGDQIAVTSTARVEFLGGAQNTTRQPQSQPRSNPPPARPNQQPQQAQRPPASTTRPAEFDQWGILDKIVDCYANIRALVNERLGEHFRPEDVPTIFIEAAKAGLVAQWNPEAKRKKSYFCPADPKNWAQAIIPSGNLEGQPLDAIQIEDLKRLHEFFNSKKANTPFAECVYQAAIDMKIFEKQPPPADPDLDAPEDDIPF